MVHGRKAWRYSEPSKPPATIYPWAASNNPRSTVKVAKAHWLGYATVPAAPSVTEPLALRHHKTQARPRRGPAALPRPICRQTSAPTSPGNGAPPSNNISKPASAFPAARISMGMSRQSRTTGNWCISHSMGHRRRPSSDQHVLAARIASHRNVKSFFDPHRNRSEFLLVRLAKPTR